MALRRRSPEAGKARRVSTDPLERRAVLLVSTRDRKSQVAACCERAEFSGVRAGMTLAHARSLLGNHPAWEWPHVPDEDSRDLERLARWSTRFAPVAVADQPDGLLLDIAGCEHLYGGEGGLVDRALASLERLGFRCRVCVAPTFAGARAVARHGSAEVVFLRCDELAGALSPLPVAALRVDPAVCRALSDVAIERVGELLAISRGDLASRFGGETLRRLDQALGVVPEHLESVVVHQPVAASRTFDGVVLHWEVVAAATRELLSAIVKELERNGRGVSDLRIEFRRTGVDPVLVSVALTHPTRDCSHLWSLVRSRMERARLDGGVEEIKMEAVRAVRRVHEQGEFWGGRSPAMDESQEGKLVDQLIDRLGRGAVARVAPVEHYVPERAFQRQPLDKVRPGRANGVYVASRPSRLFSPPEPVEVVAMAPDGPPAWLRWRGRDCPVRFSAGPERIAPPWWGDDSSGGARDYYEVQDELGRLLWVFRDGGTGDRPSTDGRWFVHGLWT